MPDVLEVKSVSKRVGDVLATIGASLPSTAMVRAIRAALLYESLDPATYLRDLGVLSLWTVAPFAVGHRLFRWHR